jgi:hypothetical protein
MGERGRWGGAGEWESVVVLTCACVSTRALLHAFTVEWLVPGQFDASVRDAPSARQVSVPYETTSPSTSLDHFTRVISLTIFSSLRSGSSVMDVSCGWPCVCVCVCVRSISKCSAAGWSGQSASDGNTLS